MTNPIYYKKHRIDCWEGFTGLWFWQVHKGGFTLSYYLPTSTTKANTRAEAMSAAKQFIDKRAA